MHRYVAGKKGVAVQGFKSISGQFHTVSLSLHLADPATVLASNKKNENLAVFEFVLLPS